MARRKYKPAAKNSGRSKSTFKSRLENATHIRNALRYMIAKWRIENKRTEELIGTEDVPAWLKENAPAYYDHDGKFHAKTVATYFKEAIEKGYVALGKERRDPYLAGKIAAQLTQLRTHAESPKPSVFVAPDRQSMLRCAWLDLWQMLRSRIEDTKCKRLVVGVSGGRTMLEFANIGPQVLDDEWSKTKKSDRQKITVCSLTSGGIRSDIAALSDTVAAIIAQHLGANVSGLLGPAWFAGKEALDAFKRDKGVDRHIRTATKADFILTSVGCVRDENSLMNKLFHQVNKADFIDRHEHLADMLYNCYDGVTGEPITLPWKIAEHVLTLLTLDSLREAIKGGRRQCFILASGKQKGESALLGALRAGLASCVYLDLGAAESLVSTINRVLGADNPEIR